MTHGARGAAILLLVASCRSPRGLGPESTALPSRRQLDAGGAPSATSAPPTVAPGANAEPADDPRAPTAPLEPGYRDLEVAGFQPTLAFVPQAAGGAPRPLVIVLHGAGGRAEPHCERWRTLTGGEAFLLCPRGAPRGLIPDGGVPTGYFYPDHHALGREVLAAVAVAREAFGARLDPERSLFAGYSQGAAMGALFLHDLAREEAPPVRFATVALVEGGAGAFNVPLSERLVETGLHRILLACGQRSCARDAARSLPWMRQGGLEVRFEDAPGAGHTWEGAVGAEVEAALPWLLAGDARWRLGGAATAPGEPAAPAGEAGRRGPQPSTITSE